MMATREHRRARIRLPARLRWNTPLGQKIELCQTMDVSRGGLLLSSKEFHSAGVPLWVTFPYDASIPDGQPEVLARVVRCDGLSESLHATEARQRASVLEVSGRKGTGKSQRGARDVASPEALPVCALAVRLEGLPRVRSNGNGAHQGPERRGSPRRFLAIPIRVRPERVPWFEEAMTLDFSGHGMRFRGQREYAVGDLLRIALDDEVSVPWTRGNEFRATVTRTSPSVDGVGLDVSVFRAS